MTARAVAVEAAERKVVARVGDDRDVGEGLRHRRTVAGEAPRHALVGAGDGVGRVVARGGVALGARRAGRDVIRGLRVTGLIGREGRRRRMAAVAVAGRRVCFVEGLRTGISPGGRAARNHAEIRRALVTGLTGGDPRGHRGVAGDRERRSGQARAAELEATCIDIARRVTARAVAVEAGERDVIARVGEDREYGIGGSDECPGDGRAMAAQTAGDTLGEYGEGIEGGVARRGGALSGWGGGWA